MTAAVFTISRIPQTIRWARRLRPGIQAIVGDHASPPLQRRRCLQLVFALLYPRCRFAVPRSPVFPRSRRSRPHQGLSSRLRLSPIPFVLAAGTLLASQDVGGSLTFLTYWRDRRSSPDRGRRVSDPWSGFAIRGLTLSCTTDEGMTTCIFVLDFSFSVAHTPLKVRR